jgi:hypothetical protein
MTSPRLRAGVLFAACLSGVVACGASQPNSSPDSAPDDVGTASDAPAEDATDDMADARGETDATLTDASVLGDIDAGAEAGPDGSEDSSADSMSESDATPADAGTAGADAAPVDAAKADANANCFEVPRTAPIDFGDSPLGMRTAEVFVPQSGFITDLTESPPGGPFQARKVVNSSPVGWYVSFDPDSIGPVSLMLDFIAFGNPGPPLCSPSGFVVSGTGTPPIPCSSLQDCPTNAAGCGIFEGFVDAGPICASN